MQGEGFFRVALTVGEERLAEAAERMGRGSLRERRSFTLPAGRAWWLVASVLAHFVVLTALVKSVS